MPLPMACNNNKLNMIELDNNKTSNIMNDVVEKCGNILEYRHLIKN